MISKALKISATAHEGQYDKHGQPYFLHCLKVMRLLKSDDEQLKIIALLHDTLEDTQVTQFYLRDEGFSDRIVNGVIAMTKQPCKNYEEYKDQVKSNPDAILVKTVKYRKFYNELMGLIK